MPTYGYHCPHCETEFEVSQRMTDDSGADCPRCGTPGRRLFFPAGIVFKGSGFYKTDSRNGGPKKKDSDTPTPAAAASEGSGSGGEGKESSKPGDAAAKDQKQSTAAPSKLAEKKPASGTPAGAGTSPST